MMAQGGIFSVVRDISVNIHWTCPTGLLPLGVLTHDAETPMSPIETNNGSVPGWEGGSIVLTVALLRAAKDGQ